MDESKREARSQLQRTSKFVLALLAGIPALIPFFFGAAVVFGSLGDGTSSESWWPFLATVSVAATLLGRKALSSGVNWSSYLKRLAFLFVYHLPVAFWIFITWAGLNDSWSHAEISHGFDQSSVSSLQKAVEGDWLRIQWSWVAMAAFSVGLSLLIGRKSELGNMGNKSAIPPSWSTD